MEYRIRKRDKLNWVIERKQEAGTISRGRYAGQQKTEKWDEVNPVGYFGNLKEAAKYLFNQEMAEETILKEGWTGQVLHTEIEAALSRVETMVKEAQADSQSETCANTLVQDIEDDSK